MIKLLSASVIFLFLSCSGGGEKEQTEGTFTDAKSYACPMQCEGNKIYSEAGKCPVCKMDLEEVAMAGTDSATHEH